MNALWLVLVFTVGMGLGLFYFGGLWLTIQRLPQSQHPGLLTLGSFLLRLLGCFAGFYAVMDGSWLHLLLALLGFLLVRHFLVRHWGPCETARF